MHYKPFIAVIMMTTISLGDVNSKAIKVLDMKKYEGMCVGLANGKVVAHSASIKEVMNDLFTKHKGEQIAVISVPKKDKVLVL
jgi:hypothetical protein